MKSKVFVMAAIVAAMMGSALPARAQVSPDKAEVLYYLPKTTIALEVEYEEVTYQQGPFYQYSERYLGTKNIVKENVTQCELKTVRINTKTEADENRSYTFTPSVMAGTNKFVLNAQGILEGFNIAYKEHKTKGDEKIKKEHPEKDFNILPLLEEQMMASSTAKMAEGAAKQIYHIREARMNLISGEVDKMPADGESMKLMLKQLQQEEDQLTALFVGKITRVKKSRIVLIEPEKKQDEVAFRFSKHYGVVDNNDLSGEPYYITIEGIKKVYATEAGKKKMGVSDIYYNVPGYATVICTDGEKTLAKKNIAIAQWGIAVPLAKDAMRAGAVVRFNPRTGALMGVQ
ncbi:MAG: DUF4831 family protein [Paludibacteraceae bacterium]|nr:DUF4831 family protein [Paludibacteraceae bacterium]